MTKIKNVLAIVLIIGLVTMPQVSAFTIFGFDFGQAWSNFWGEEQTSTTQNSNQSQIPEEIFTITVMNISFTNKQVVDIVNSNEQIVNVLEKISYECLYVNSDNNLNVTAYFDQNKLIQISKGKKCEDEIFFNESIINDVKEGIEPSRIREYLEKVEMPVGMYFSLVRAFA